MPPEITTLDFLGRRLRVATAGDRLQYWKGVATGSWEPTTLAAITTILSEGGTYIDVGSYIGPTVLAAAPFADRVVAYEPDPEAVLELRRNVELNDFKNVDVREIALFDRSGPVPFGPGRSNSFGKSESSLVFGNHTTTVQAIDARIESRKEEFRSCRLMKIDVEGAEFYLIPALTEYLTTVKPALLLSVHELNHAISRAIYLRFRMYWCLRHYGYVYVDDKGAWRRIAPTERLSLPLRPSGRQLLMSDKPLSLR